MESLANEHSWTASALTESQRRLESRPTSGRLRATWKQWRLHLLPRRKMEALINRYVAAGNLLDVGCGSGGHFPRLPAAIVPHGIEIDPDAIELATARAGERGGRVIQADALSGLQSLPTAEMKGIVMHSFLEHEVQPLEVLQDAKRVLLVDGALIIKVPNFACWNRRYWHGAEWPGFRYPDHVNYFTPSTLSQLVLKAGLRILQFTWRDRIPTNDNMWLVAGKHP